jgi:SAM-dependent methyltransferase
VSDHDHVAPDGSPLSVYLALPAGDEPLLVHGAVPAGASLLELGSGPGRLTRVLVALGHRVTAVDDSAEMLAHVTGARTVCSPVLDLALPERYDAVVVASHLVNTAVPGELDALLDACVRHLAPGGSVLVERYPEGWLATHERTSGKAGPVAIELERLALEDGVATARATYTLAGRRWQQEFRARDLSDDELGAAAARAGLRVAGWLDEPRTWGRLVADGRSSDEVSCPAGAVRGEVEDSRPSGRMQP